MIDFKIIAVDFDGTLCENKWPEIGNVHVELVDHLKEEQKKGVKLILWTCRTERALEEAVAWCTAIGLTFDAINENLPEVKVAYGTGGNKIYADRYIDDKACRMFNLPYNGNVYDADGGREYIVDAKGCEIGGDHSGCSCKKPVPTKVKSDSERWAEREIELAFPKDKKDDDTEYGHDCCDSAMRAYTALIADQHSGMSIGLTKEILNRLIDHKPLSKIEDIPESWNYVATDKDGKITYQSSRASSLFKDVKADGTILYNDIDRVYCVDAADPNNTYTSGFVTHIIQEMFPITMPYYPTVKRFKVVCEEALTDKRNGDFDTVAILFVTTPDGDDIEINRYFKEGPNDWIEITSLEYMARVMAAARGERSCV